MEIWVVGDRSIKCFDKNRVLESNNDYRKAQSGSLTKTIKNKF
jgi:hypothetical protein